MKYALYSFVVVFTLLVFDGVVHADQHREIPGGASMADVLELWGHPDEKVVKEVKREVVWYYPDEGKVVFRDGIVKKWSYPSKYRNVLIDREKSPAASVELDKEAEALVRDMADAVRGTGGASRASPPSSGLIDQKPPLIRSRNNRVPRGVPVGDDEGDMDEDDEDFLEE